MKLIEWFSYPCPRQRQFHHMNRARMATENKLWIHLTFSGYLLLTEDSDDKGYRCRKKINPKSKFFVILIIITLTYQFDPWCYEKRRSSRSQGCDPWSHPLADLWSLIPYTLFLPWLKGWTLVFLILLNFLSRTSF